MQEFGRGVLVGVLVMSLICGITYGVWQVMGPNVTASDIPDVMTGTDDIDAADDTTGAVLVCSFCGKSQTEVRKLIAGPSVYICDECVSLCGEIVAEDDPDWAEQQCKLMQGVTPATTP